MSPQETLERFAQAFAQKDASALTELFDQAGLLELPLAGQRLVGCAEIRAGARRIFEELDLARMTLTKMKFSSTFAIAEGKLEAKRKGAGETSIYALAIVALVQGASAQRISVYLDAYNQRPWIDGRVFAAG